MVHGESKSLVFGAIALACAGLMLISHGLSGKRKKTAKPDEPETAVAHAPIRKSMKRPPNTASVSRPAIASRETATDRGPLEASRSPAVSVFPTFSSPTRAAHVPARRGPTLSELIGDDLAGELREALEQNDDDRAFLASRAGLSKAMIERVNEQQKQYYNELRRIDQHYLPNTEAARYARDRLTRDHIRWMEGTLGYETYHRMLNRSLAGL